MKSEEAEKLFRSGANCAQAVVGAYAEECGLEFDRAMQMACSFGGGMGRLREVCGAVSGMLIVLGLKQGYCDLGCKDVKDQQYARVQALAAEFKRRTGSIICRELRGSSEGADTPVSEERTAKYYRNRPCVELVSLAAAIVEEHFKAQANHLLWAGANSEQGPS